MHKIAANNPCVLIITGPTASGKTALGELILQKFSGEVINADVGQFYVPLSVGTAKPDLSTVSYVTHGFDLINNPCDLSVVEYRALVINFVDHIVQRSKIPIIVGGSLFYIKSLFFPPCDLEMKRGVTKDLRVPSSIVDGQSLWQQLHAIDPIRADKLHPHDEYRIKRALAIWQQTGIKPSRYTPNLQMPFKAMIVFVYPGREILNANIKKRVNIMMQQGWIEETEKLVGTLWEPFLQKKGLIGYFELINWIKHGKQRADFDRIVTTIQNKTIAYAKRQGTFWKSFAKQLKDVGVCTSKKCLLQTVAKVDIDTATHIANQFVEFCNIK